MYEYGGFTADEEFADGGRCFSKHLSSLFVVSLLLLLELLLGSVGEACDSAGLKSLVVCSVCILNCQI